MSSNDQTDKSGQAGKTAQGGQAGEAVRTDKTGQAGEAVKTGQAGEAVKTGQAGEAVKTVKPGQAGEAVKTIWTVLELLRWTTDHFAKRGIATARLDAECLLAAALDVPRMRLYIDFDKPVSPEHRAVYREHVVRRANERVPVAQLVGEKEFWSMPLRVTPDVLTPRPDTETLVSAALDALPDRESAARVLDIGTGTGAVALAIARERPNAQITATDVSPAALEVARANALALGLADRIRFVEGSLFDPVASERFDLVVSNPPYVGESERAGLAPELSHEPDIAVFAGENGLEILAPLVSAVKDALAEGGSFAVELAPAQAKLVAQWCGEAGLHDIVVHRDLAELPRVVSARATPSRRAPSLPPSVAPSEVG